MATPMTGPRPGAPRESSTGDDRRIRLEDILKLMAPKFPNDPPIKRLPVE